MKNKAIISYFYQTLSIILLLQQYIAYLSIDRIVKIFLLKEKVNLCVYGIDENVYFHQMKGFQ